MGKGSGAVGKRQAAAAVKSALFSAPKTPSAPAALAPKAGANWGGNPGTPTHAIAKAFDSIQRDNDAPIAEVFAKSGLSRPAFDAALNFMRGKSVSLSEAESRFKIPDAYRSEGLKVNRMGKYGAETVNYVYMSKR